MSAQSHESAMAVDLFADEPVVTPFPPPNCCQCGRFVNIKTAQQHVDRGDYGTVYSVEFECQRCFTARRSSAFREGQSE